MRPTAHRFAALLLSLAALVAMPSAAADRAYPAEAPWAPKVVRAEHFRLEPGASPARRIELDAMDAAQIESVKKANAERFLKRLQIGIGRTIAPRLRGEGSVPVWHAASGGVAAQWEVASPGAQALRLGLDIARLPDGAEIRFAGYGDIGTVYGPFSAADIGLAAGTYWSPVLEGDRAVVEVFLPDAASTGGLVIDIGQVSHLFASPANPDVERMAKAAQACEVDLVCLSATDTALASVGKAVARMTFSDGLGGGTFLCTGTLLNTTAGPVAPNFYSAAHCISTQASATTLTTHWFYDRTGCGTGNISSSYVQVTGGATLLYADATTDVLLLRLNQNPPAGAVYGGWDAAAVAVSAPLTAVHHPAGDLKKVSLGTSGGFSGYLGGAGSSHLIALWNSTATGVTEGGSSGSGIFTFSGSSYFLRGGLHGGPSSCSASGVDLRDYYSRFDLAYATLSPWLDPSACTFVLSPTTASVGAGATGGSFNVTTSPGCAWTASSNAAWLTTTSSGSGSGSVSYSVAANSGLGRTGTITVGGQSFNLTQQAGAVGVRGDVNADRKADLFWREAAGVGLSWWAMNGNAILGSNYFQLDSAWQIADVGDLDGDGKTDILWRRASDGANYLWTIDGLAIKGFFDLGILNPAQWSLVGIADLDGDGRGDIVWRGADGSVYGWLMNGGTIASQGAIGNPGTQWVIADLADMDGDGKADIVFRNVNDGGVYVYFMNGLSIASGGFVGIVDPVAWTLAGAADFSGDGKADLLWRHTSGDTWVWLMNGATFQSAGGIGNPGAGWSVRSLGDFDGDGKVDLLWRHTDGTTYLWKMNGAGVSSYLPVANPGGTWQTVAP